MPEELTPLPPPASHGYDVPEPPLAKQDGLFTADQMRAYALENRRAQPAASAQVAALDALTAEQERLGLYEKTEPAASADADYPCRSDGRCQYAIDHGAEGMGHCPRGKCAMADAAPSVAPEPPTRETLAEIVRSHLTSTYHCVRVWEAWHVGTMTEDDFEPASESDMAEDIADAILAAHPPREASVAPEPGEPLPEVLFNGYGVWHMMTPEATRRTTPENVSDVLDAVVKWLRANPAHSTRAPLTDAEIDKAISTSRDALLDHIFEHGTTAEGIASRFREVARAIEAAHGIRRQG